MEVCCNWTTSASFTKRFIMCDKSSSSSSSPQIRTRTKTSRARVSERENLERETHKVLEWDCVCRQVSGFASTTMGSSAARTGNLPIGRSREESQKLLNQTTAALLLPQPFDFSGVQDITEIVNSSVRGELRSIRELCSVKRTLAAARGLYQQLNTASTSQPSSNRYSSLSEILRGCDFLNDLEHKIEFCIDCTLSVLLDRASESLKSIRSERKRNMRNLESLLKEVSTRIFQAGGVDSPLVTKRRSRMCVGIRASHKSLLPDGIVLNTSGSGATYFMEPRDAVELNNMEVRLSNSEKAEELAILSMLTSEIAESDSKIMDLLERILKLDLVSARAAYAEWIDGVCPVFDQNISHSESSKLRSSLSVDIEGIRHPVLLESSLKSFSQVLESRGKDGIMQSGILTDGSCDLPIPIDIKISSVTKVVVISGPNTGGKTASMKTLGLASLMSKAGLYLPAKERPRLPWFDIILADIGDNQSLEQNLSTFSGHISRICKILELASKESLVLIDEIGCGTDPSEGAVLSASILQYLKDQVNLAVVTTHYEDLSCLKEMDSRFENAAMEFSLETLRPTYHILWGCIGNSNALTIAKLIGLDQKVLDRAHFWVEKLRPDKQIERKGVLYQQLLEERNMLEAQATEAMSIYSETMRLYEEISTEAKDLDRRTAALTAKETEQVTEKLNATKAQIDEIVKKFESQINNANTLQFNTLVKESEAAISSVVEAHQTIDGILVRETYSTCVPQVGEQVHVKGFGSKLASIVEAPGDDDMVLVQYGKLKIRVNKNRLNSVKATQKSKRNDASMSIPGLKRLASLKISGRTPEVKNMADVQYGPVVQTSKNSVDLHGMRVEEASHQLSLAIASSRSKGLLFVIHGMGTGVLKERVLEVLRKHPRIAKLEQESPMNYGCTVAYIK